MKTKIVSYKAIVCIVMILLAALLLCYVHCTGDQQESVSAKPLTFQGEYALDDGTWAELTENTTLFARPGNLTLRGSFDREIPKGEQIYIYLNHVAMRAEINGAEYVRTDSWDDTDSSLCGASWFPISSPGLTPEDEIVFYLCNSHKFGNPDAYTLMLENIYCGSQKAILNALITQEQFLQTSGRSLILIALPLFGMALAFVQLRHSSMRLKTLYFSFTTFFMGGYIVLDSRSWAFWNNWLVFNTYGKMLCLVLALYVFHLFVEGKVLNGFRRLMELFWFAETLSIGGILFLSLAGRLHIYDTLLFWGAMQIILNTVLFGCIIYEYLLGKIQSRTDSMVCLVMMIAILLDMANLYWVRWPVGVVSKVTYVVLFIGQIIRGNIYLTRLFRSVMRTKHLEKDLENANATIAISQIRAHFIFNILNAISGMCKYDPAKADETVVLFSRYLRANINILNDDAPIPFGEALEYLEGYIALEQVRFGSKIRFEKDIEADDFRIPALLMQPIAENAIKHGLLPKPEGGTITLRTRKIGRQYHISIADDGVGFEPGNADPHLSVGLENVRVRLEHHAGGKMKIESAPGQGATVTFIIPCEEAK